MLEKVSVIVPIYNVEKYLIESIESLIIQTYTNLEIWLIDDGSTDGSKMICEEYQKKDTRIHYYYQQNMGVSSARNIGLNIASGKYIYFMDPDDRIDKTLIEKLVRNNIYDMRICGFYELYMNKLIEHKCTNKEIILDKNKVIEEIFEKGAIGGFLWNKIFRLDLIKKYQIQFNEDICMLEDMIFVIQYLLKIESIGLIPDSLYYYRMRKSSAIWKKNNECYNSYKVLLSILKENKIDSISFKYMLCCSRFLDKKMVKDFGIKTIYNELIIKKCISRKRKLKLVIYRRFNFLYKTYILIKSKKNKFYN